MTVGSLHVAETLEFMLALRQIEWNGLIQLDQFPFREDPVGAARTSIATIRRLERALDALDEEALNGGSGGARRAGRSSPGGKRPVRRKLMKATKVASQRASFHKEQSLINKGVLPPQYTSAR